MLKPGVNGPGNGALNIHLSAEGAKCIKYSAPSAFHRVVQGHNPGRCPELLHFAPLALELLSEMVRSRY